MAGLHRNADLAVGLEAADAGTVPGRIRQLARGTELPAAASRPETGRIAARYPARKKKHR